MSEPKEVTEQDATKAQARIAEIDAEITKLTEERDQLKGVAQFQEFPKYIREVNAVAESAEHEAKLKSAGKSDEPAKAIEPQPTLETDEEDEPVRAASRRGRR